MRSEARRSRWFCGSWKSSARSCRFSPSVLSRFLISWMKLPASSANSTYCSLCMAGTGSKVGWVESSEPTRPGGFRRLHPPYSLLSLRPARFALGLAARAAFAAVAAAAGRFAAVPPRRRGAFAALRPLVLLAEQGLARQLHAVLVIDGDDLDLHGVADL